MSKKIFLASIILAFVFVTLFQFNVFAVTHTLSEIVEKFNNSSVIASYGELFGYTFSASTNDNVLSVTLTNTEGSSTVDYELEGSILSSNSLNNNSLITAYLLADSIGEVNGYEAGEIINNFNVFGDEISNYTVANEGFEIKQNGSNYSVKMDIDKKVPLIDESSVYLKPEDLEIIKHIIDDGEAGNQSGKKSKLSYDIQVSNDENTIYIGEKDELTESSYKSILSALEVMYGDKVVDYFKSNYPEFFDGTMEFDGFIIEKDPDIDLEEYPIFTDSKIVLVRIDNQYVKDEILRTEYIGETVKRGDKTLMLDFAQNKSYKLGFLDSAKSSDAAFLFKYILEPIFIEANAELDNQTAYFNISNGKIVVGDKNNSIFKIVVGDEYIELLPIRTDVEKTTVTAKHENVKVIEYEEGKGQDHFRYGEYNVTVNVVYGEKEPENKTINPKTGDNIIMYVVMAIASVSILTTIILVMKRKK